MATTDATATTTPPRRGSGRRQPPAVVQPPQKFAHLRGDALYTALTTDDESWDSQRIAAESGRGLNRVHKWVHNYYKAAENPGGVPNQRAFIAPDGYHGRSPWWTAGRARAWMIQNGVMTREGVAIPYRPAGRRRGTPNLTPRRRSLPTMAETAGDILAQYRSLRAAGKGYRAARAELAAALGLNRTQLSRRLHLAEQIEAGQAAAAQVDNADLARRHADLLARLVAAGHTAEQADDRARDELVAQTGLSRRVLSGRIIAGAKAAEQAPAA